MKDSTLLICFDINSIREENQIKQNDDKEELIEEPINFFNNFFSNHKSPNMTKTELSTSEMKYEFTLTLPDSVLFQIISINNLSFIHEISLEADAYLIFINLEDAKTVEKLEYLIRYITESCSSVDIITYIVGLYKEKILDVCNKEELENLFNEHNLVYDYFEIKYTGIKNQEHFCFYKYIEDKNYNDKAFFTKKFDEYQTFEIFEKIMFEIYENKMNVKFDKFKRKFVSKSDKVGSGDKSGECNII